MRSEAWRKGNHFGSTTTGTLPAGCLLLPCATQNWRQFEERRKMRETHARRAVVLLVITLLFAVQPKLNTSLLLLTYVL